MKHSVASAPQSLRSLLPKLRNSVVSRGRSTEAPHAETFICPRRHESTIFSPPVIGLLLPVCNKAQLFVANSWTNPFKVIYSGARPATGKQQTRWPKQEGTERGRKKKTHPALCWASWTVSTQSVWRKWPAVIGASNDNRQWEFTASFSHSVSGSFAKNSPNCKIQREWCDQSATALFAGAFRKRDRASEINASVNSAAADENQQDASVWKRSSLLATDTLLTAGAAKTCQELFTERVRGEGGGVRTTTRWRPPVRKQRGCWEKKSFYKKKKKKSLKQNKAMWVNKWKSKDMKINSDTE